jgi:cell division protein FtsQ
MIKKILVITVLVLIAAYLVVAFVTFNRKPEGEVCAGVEYNIRQSANSQFITRQEIEALLKSKHLYPKGEVIDSVICRNIEDFLRQDSRVEEVECYKRLGNKVCIDIKQREPILRIIDAQGKNYFVDSKGNTMPDAPCSAYLPVATGYIDQAMATKELYEFARFLQRDKFWNAQIQQIQVTADKEWEMVPRIGDHVVFLGKPEQLEEKLARLKEFYEKGLNTVGWNKYSRISLEFNNQVICTKKEK